MEIFLFIVSSFFIILFFGLLPRQISKHIEKKADDKVRYQNVEKMEDDSIYYREIPFDNLGDAFWLSYCAGLMEDAEDIFYAFLLKWHLENYISVYKDHGVYYAKVKKKIPYIDELETKVFKHIFLLGAYKRPVKISNIRFTNNLTLEKTLRISYHKLQKIRIYVT